MSIRHTAHINQLQSKVVDDNNKKELKQETADIRGFTLMFDDAEMEKMWNLVHLDRQRSITSRYLLCAAIFQGLFFWSDVIEYNHFLEKFQTAQDSLFHMLYIRLLLGGFPLVAFFLVTTGLLNPSQMTIYWINICYGIPTLAVKYLMNSSPSHWDSLFLVYGLCFFILPKVSPLGFIYGFSGAVTFSTLYAFISSFRLNVQEWLLSNIMLIFLSALFCYVSYSSEKISREKWLLTQRLKRERIDLKFVSSSIRDDLSRVSNDDRPFPLETIRYPSIFVANSRDRALKLLSKLSGVGGSQSGNPINDDKKPNTIINKTSKKERMILFFKGIAGWALCYGMGYAFDRASTNFSSSKTSEINSSAAFALLMHSMGFSIFLLYVTGQLRWIALNGIVSLVMLRIFNRTIDSKWVVFSTHTVGYILLTVCIIVMVLVFGGVVLVWTQLVDFLKQILIKYPQVKDEILENNVIEQVLVEYISNIPSSYSILNTPNTTKSIQVVRTDGENQVVISGGQSDMETGGEYSDHFNISQKLSHNTSPCSGKTVISAKRPNSCFFCLKSDPMFLIPACSAWQKNTSSSSSSKSSGIPMCTPYTALALERDEAVEALSHMEEAVNTLEEKYRLSSNQVKNLSQRLQESDHALQTLSVKMSEAVANEKKNHEKYIQDIFSQQNAQQTAIKKLNKALQQKMINLVKDYRSLEATCRESIVEAVNEESSSASHKNLKDKSIKFKSKPKAPAVNHTPNSSNLGVKELSTLKSVDTLHDDTLLSSLNVITEDPIDFDFTDFEEIEKLLNFEMAQFSDYCQDHK